MIFILNTNKDFKLINNIDWPVLTLKTFLYNNYVQFGILIKFAFLVQEDFFAMGHFFTNLIPQLFLNFPQNMHTH